MRIFIREQLDRLAYHFGYIPVRLVNNAKQLKLDADVIRAARKEKTYSITFEKDTTRAKALLRLSIVTHGSDTQGLDVRPLITINHLTRIPNRLLYLVNACANELSKALNVDVEYLYNGTFEPEMIKGVALLDDENLYWLDQPNRHHDLYRMCNDKRIQLSGQEQQGFITNTDRFVDRVSAIRIARNANQIKTPLNTNELFSENLW